MLLLIVFYLVFLTIFVLLSLLGINFLSDFIKRNSTIRRVVRFYKITAFTVVVITLLALIVEGIL